MPNWNQVLNEIVQEQANHQDALDRVRRKYLKLLHTKRNRNVIAYYSGWLQKPGMAGVEIDDNDKNGFMATIHGLDRSLGLDLILHTPGGQVAAAESLVDYLKSMFTDIRVFVPQIAMSAGTMIACASKEVFMGKQSSLGPIDPQFNGIPASEVIDEFKRAVSEIAKDPSQTPLWQVIVGKYPITFLLACENAIKWSEEIVTKWLASEMLRAETNPTQLAEQIVRELSDHKQMKAHARHINKDEAKRIGLKISDLESDQELQDLVLTTHHAFMHTFHNSLAIKVIENHLGIAVVNIASTAK